MQALLAASSMTFSDSTPDYTVDHKILGAKFETEIGCDIQKLNRKVSVTNSTNHIAVHTGART